MSEIWSEQTDREDVCLPFLLEPPPPPSLFPGWGPSVVPYKCNSERLTPILEGESARGHLERCFVLEIQPSKRFFEDAYTDYTGNGP